MIDKLKESLLSLKNLNRMIGRELVFKSMTSNLKHQLIDNVPKGRVIVFAPHPDDEMIGCAGALLKHKKNNDQIRIVYMTDGSAGSEPSERYSPKQQKDLVIMREEEAKNASKIITNDLMFLRYKDSELKANKNNIAFIKQMIKDFKPDLIYVPSVLDSNNDHVETARIVASSLSVVDNIRVYSYEIWSPIFANVILKIDDEIEKKKDLISFYKSQLKNRQYLDAIVGLNRYRAGMFNFGEYAEGFFSSDVELFKKIVQIYFKK